MFATSVRDNIGGFTSSSSPYVYRSHYGYPPQFQGLGSLDSWLSKTVKKVTKTVTEAVKDVSATFVPDKIEKAAQDTIRTGVEVVKDALPYTLPQIAVYDPKLREEMTPVIQAIALLPGPQQVFVASAAAVLTAEQQIKAAQEAKKQATTAAQAAQADADLLVAQVQLQQVQEQEAGTKSNALYWVGGTLLLYLILR